MLQTTMHKQMCDGLPETVGLRAWQMHAEHFNKIQTKTGLKNIGPQEK